MSSADSEVGGGNDTINGNAGDDRLRGNAGQDTINGSARNGIIGVP